MMRIILLATVLTSGAFLLMFVLSEKTQTPLGRTFSPLFSLMGQQVKTADRILSRVLPVDSVDESQLGEAIKASMRNRSSSEDSRSGYLQSVLDYTVENLHSKYRYEIFIVDGAPNAAAMPGGALLITRGLLDVLQSEAELVSILGHEVGHVERGHCFDSVRFELLSRRLGSRTLGEIADLAYGITTRMHFSKSQEMESDRYGFELLVAAQYDPMGMSGAFERLKAASRPQGGAGIPDPFRDYVDSHPPVALRIENYRELGRRWIRSHEVRFYRGEKNFQEKIPRSKQAFEAEWHRD